ncbi:MAG: LL-diaminopimelate aminotransferase [Clostridia bacterium]|nr:LL-diaminopimelate aminotransferase [Clostridia bacterium]
MPALNPHLAAMPAGYLFREVAARIAAYEKANPGKRVLSLGIGDVTRPLPEAATRAMASAALEMSTPEGFRGYGPENGYDFLLRAICKRLYEPRGVTLGTDEVFVSDGAKTDTGALQELLAPEARVAVTDPVYPVYVDSNAMAGRAGSYRGGLWSHIEYLPCVKENGFAPPLPRHYVDAVYLCFPNNPTGVALPLAELQRYVDWALESGALIIFDAAYSAFISSPEVPRSIYECRGAKECAIECGSFSKLAGFTGVRCGYTVIPKKLYGGTLNRMWRRRLAVKSNGVSYPVQRAAEAVLTPEGLRACRENIDYYMNNARLIRNTLRGAGLEVFGGVDAPYVWLRAPEGMSGWQLLDRLLERAQVAGTPGEGFGPSGAGYFRLTAFGTLENTKEALQRICAALREGL